MVIKMKKFLLCTCFCFGVFLSIASFADETDPMNFDNFAEINANDDDDYSVPETVSLDENSSFVDVNHFDIAGVMLGMDYDEINELFFTGSNLYAPRKKNSVVYGIDKEWKYNLDYECRQNNVFIPEKLERCIYSLAKQRGLLYVSEIHLERDFTGEKVDIFFTSNATDNVVWKVEYTNDADDLDGVDSESNGKFSNQREKKLLAFWQGVIDKYGQPNSGEDKWISEENEYAPMLQAFYGKLVLVDEGLHTTDISENVLKAKENFQAKPYAF